MRDSLIEWSKAIVSAAAAALIIVQFILPTMVEGTSMEPTLNNEEYLLINKQAYFGDRRPAAGDIVVFESRLKDEENRNKNLIKRVIAVPGDKIQITGGEVYINGVKLEERYIKDDVTNGDVGPVTVPEGYLFCMGDNRLHSTDSRALEVGFVDSDDIIGKAFFRVYPFEKFGVVGSNQ